MPTLDSKYNILKPFKNKNLIRLGNNADGGYVVDEKIIKNLKSFISFGLGDGSNIENCPWSFENHLIKKNKSIQIYIYDHTVGISDYLRILSKYFRRLLIFRTNYQTFKKKVNYLLRYLKLINRKKTFFFKKKISNINQNNQINVQNVIRVNNIDLNNIGLKCDIEGDEYKIINSILKYQKAINIILIEFHDIEKNKKIFINSIKKINQFYNIIHLHGNNHASVGKDFLPNVLEITFIKKTLSKEKKKINKSYPIKKLDYPSNLYLKDISFRFK